MTQKTPDYTKKAIENYRSKFDLVQIRLPKGTKDKIKAIDPSININNIINDFIADFIKNNS